MTDRELLELLVRDVQSIKTDMQGMKAELRDVKEDQQVMKADMQSMNAGLRDVKEDQQVMKADIQSMKKEIQVMKADMQSMNAELRDVKEDQRVMKADMQSMKKEMQIMKADMQSVNAGLRDVKKDQQTLDKRFLYVETILENETNRNIKVIAEGHLDLTRKLDEALRVENEKEMFLLRLNKLESEVQILKQKIG